MEDDYNPSEKAVKIVEKIKEMTGIPAIFIERKPNTVQPSLTDSKFGGLPYWDMEKEYPTDSKGERMMLLAQINFSDLCAFDTELPKEGMLQFFITVDDDVFGMDFDDPVSQKDFRVVFHDTVRQDVTEEQVQALDIVRAEEVDDYGTPIFRQAALSFRAGIDSMSSDIEDFPTVFVQAVKAVTGEEIDEENWYEYFGEDTDDGCYLSEELSGLGHKMLGYPGFIQFDPREDKEDRKYYDTLLLQIDSDMGEDGEDYVLWGDCGVANLFINKEALIKRDFSNILYNWDCS
ncbi:MAG: DUF1963 domain-containing protein [Lachnospiraceae bacterium]|jgi:uncharacterized protein YwqG|nr:DUF1963 domain-containing protein [Lachnospiraceae bacterium]